MAESSGTKDKTKKTTTKKPEEVKEPDFLGEAMGTKKEAKPIPREEVRTLKDYDIRRELETYETQLKESPTPTNVDDVLGGLKDLRTEIKEQGKIKGTYLSTRFDDDIVELGAIADLMKTENIGYDEAKKDFYGMKFEQERNTPLWKKPAAYGVAAAVVGAAGLAAWGVAEWAEDRLEAREPGEGEATAIQKADPHVPSIGTDYVAGDTDLPSTYSISDMDKFMNDVYPSLSAAQQNSVYSSDEIDKMTDGNITNGEIKRIDLIDLDVNGGAKLRLTYDHIDDNGARMEYIEKPRSISNDFGAELIDLYEG